jgi:hypothetical protein
MFIQRAYESAVETVNWLAEGYARDGIESVYTDADWAELRADVDEMVCDAADAGLLVGVWGDPGTFGHDFILTRGGHGAGFWDRYYDGGPLEAAGAALTRMCKPFGDFEPSGGLVFPDDE